MADKIYIVSVPWETVGVYRSRSDARNRLLQLVEKRTYGSGERISIAIWEDGAHRAEYSERLRDGKWECRKIPYLTEDEDGNIVEISTT